MSAYLNQKLWKKSYMLEFWDGITVAAVFTFSVPPQNEELTYPQRISETKTFGGSVFEDYGNDTVQISLSGTTINQQPKIIYRGSGSSPDFLTGEEEIFNLKDMLETYGQLNKLNNKRVYLYCLEQSNGLSIKPRKSNDKRWRIWVQEFQIRRNKDRPLTYDYTLKAAGIPIAKDVSAPKLTWIKTIDDWIKKVALLLDELKDTVSSFWQDNILFYISAAKDTVQSINTLCKTLASYSYEAIDLANNLLIETFNETSALGKEVSTTVNMPFSVGTKIANSCTELVQTVKQIKDWYRDVKKEDSNSWSLAKSYYKTSKEDLADALCSLVHDIDNNANGLVARAKMELSANNSYPVVVPGGKDNADSVIVAHGYKEYTFTDGDTWVSIASKTYNNPSYATMLQLYNNNMDIENLTAGTVICIPTFSQDERNDYQNQVYNEHGTTDFAGKDIKIKNSDIAVKNGDFDTTKGNENITQAIKNRLSSSINTRVRNVVYGIRNKLGVPDDEQNAASVYITASIEQTVLADPRIESIEALSWSGINGGIQIELLYKTVVESSNTYKGVI